MAVPRPTWLLLTTLTVSAMCGRGRCWGCFLLVGLVFGVAMPKPPLLGAGYGAHLPWGQHSAPSSLCSPSRHSLPSGAPSWARNVSLLLETDLCSSAKNLLDAADAQHHLCSQGEEEEEGGRAGKGDAPALQGALH